MKKDITNQVEFDENDGELLPLTKCACGHRWNSWDFTIDTDERDPHECPYCGRKLFFEITIKVYEANDG